MAPVAESGSGGGEGLSFPACVVVGPGSAPRAGGGRRLPCHRPVDNFGKRGKGGKRRKRGRGGNEEGGAGGGGSRAVLLGPAAWSVVAFLVGFVACLDPDGVRRGVGI